MTLDDLLTVEDGIKFYIEHLEECKEKSKPIKVFFRKYDTKNNEFLLEKIGKLNRYYARFLWLRKKGELPEGVKELEEWIALQIPEELNKKLEELSERYLREYSLGEGVEFYIKHLEKYKEESKPIKAFFEKYDVKNNGFFSKRGFGKLNRHYARFLWLRKKGRLPERIKEFKEWIALQIPEELKQKLEGLSERYIPKKEVKEYSLEQGVKFYIKHLEECKEESKSIKVFFAKYDTENNEFHPEKGPSGKLVRHYATFRRLKKNEKLPEGVKEFEEWVALQIPEELNKKLEEFGESYLKHYSLEEGVEFYIQHLEECKEESKPITSFFMKYDVKDDRFDSEKKGKLRKHYDEFLRLKGKGKLPEGVKEFEEWVALQIPEELNKKLGELSKRCLRKYSIEEGVEFYIQHLEECKEESKPITSFFMKYDAENNEFHPKKDHGGNLNRHYHKFGKLRRKGKLPEGVTTIEDYLIHQLPEEKRKRAEYYLKGQFLKDIAKREIDREQLKIVVLGGN